MPPPLASSRTLVLIRRNTNKPHVSIWAGLVTTLRLVREVPRRLLRREHYPWPEVSWRNIAGAFIGRVNGRS